MMSKKKSVTMKNVSTSDHMNNHRTDFPTNTFFLITDLLTYDNRICRLIGTSMNEVRKCNTLHSSRP